MTDKASYAGTGDALAARRGAGDRAPRARARRHGRGRRRARSCCSSPPAPTPSGTRRSSAPPGCRPTARTGRGYFGQQQVVDLLAYLRLLHNRYDDEALADRARVAARRRLERRARADPPRGARGGRSSPGSRRRCRPRSPPTTSGCCARSSSATSGSCAASARLSLERLCEQIVAEHDYDLAVLAHWDGRRRYANLRKLARLARSYEELRGRRHRGLRPLRPRAGGGRREGARGGRRGGGRRRGAAADDPRRQGARVQGRDRRRRGPRPAAARPRTRSSRSRTGASASGSPTRTRASGAAAFGTRRCAQARKEQEAAERLRLYYVAMTRAIDRLIVSGAIDPEKARRLDADRLGARAARSRRRPRDRRGRRPSSSSAATRGCCVRLDRFAPAAEPEPRPPPSRSRPRTASSRSSTSVRRRRPRRRRPSCPRSCRRRRRRSTTCAGSRSARSRSSSAARTATSPSASPGCASCAPAHASGGRRPARDRDRRRRPPAARAGRPRATRACPTSSRFASGTRPSTDEELERIRGLVESYCASEPGARGSPRSPGAGAERPFAFEHDGVLLHGRLDVLHRDGERALVVDYKTNLLGERARPTRSSRPSTGSSGSSTRSPASAPAPTRSRSSTSSSSGPTSVVSARLRARRRAGARGELSEAIAEIQAGEFVPTPSEFACAGCPALDVVCAGPRLPGRAPAGRAAAPPSASSGALATSARRAGASGRSASGSGRSSSG